MISSSAEDDKVVVFNYHYFIEAYPLFKSFSDRKLQNYFDLSCLLLNNTGRSAVQCLTARKAMLWLLVAHMATLSTREVGRISSAGEGSVSVGTEYPMANNAAYFNQTQYGATYWQTALSYRSFRFRPRNVTII